jgi:colicin D
MPGSYGKESEYKFRTFVTEKEDVRILVETATLGQLQAKFKLAEDFGVKGNWNKATAPEFDQAVQNHVSDPATQTINGTCRGQSVVHDVNPQTGLNVMTDPAGKFISGWKLNPQQLQNVLTRGSL